MEQQKADGDRTRDYKIERGRAAGNGMSRGEWTVHLRGPSSPCSSSERVERVRGVNDVVAGRVVDGNELLRELRDPA